MTTYYLDAIQGTDINAGTSPGEAWKTFERVNASEFSPGDRILLKAETEFSGGLAPKGSGSENAPIVIDRYGRGQNPVINGNGKVENTVFLRNQQYWEICNLTITNTDGGDLAGDEGRAIRRAVYVTAEDAGELKHIHLKSLEVHNIRGMYRFGGSLTNGGIICRVLGNRIPTRFVDLRIEGCVFRTRSIDRYPAIVTSSWQKSPACDVVWRDNTFDHFGRAHIVIPSSEWPRKFVYYFDPEASEVFALGKHDPPVSPLTGRVGCEDVFSEIAARLRHTWTFFETTRVARDRWLFANSKGDVAHHPNDGVYTSPTYPLAYYCELRSLGFVPPWLDLEDERHGGENVILQEWVDELVGVGVKREEDWTICNRAFMNENPWPEPRSDTPFVDSVSRYGVAPDLSTRESARTYFESLPWKNNPYAACNFIGKALHNYRYERIGRGGDPDDENYLYIKDLIGSQFQEEEGYWGGSEADHINRTSGNMKMLTTYAVLDWEIPNPKKIMDFILSGANDEMGFAGAGCSAFNQMASLCITRFKYPELSNYRSEEIERYSAMTFMTFLDNWSEETNFYGDTWLGKHNNGVVVNMATLLLDLPLQRASTIYNWRDGPIIFRQSDGKIIRNQVIYQLKGHAFAGGG
ncbi:MAG: hypothetical protein HN368_12910 [Spirochaetales bacterium]|jgi:hypothetical protein|nr:hypothetical protein [Spirochaetales bacterium]